MKIRIFLTAALAAIALFLAACGDPEVVVVVATPTPAPVPTATTTPTSTPGPQPTATIGQIAFSSDRDNSRAYGNHHIYVMDADGGNVRRLTGTRGHRDYLAGDYDPAWSPVP